MDNRQKMINSVIARVKRTPMKQLQELCGAIPIVPGEFAINRDGIVYVRLDKVGCMYNVMRIDNFIAPTRVLEDLTEVSEESESE